MRTALAVFAVALAVVSVTLLGSLGAGVVETGQQKFDSADRDLWISGGPLRIAPGTVGCFQGGVVDAPADRASMITVDVAPGSDVGAVERDLEDRLPTYTVQTNSEQLESIIGNRILLVAAGVVLTVVAVVSGIALSANLLALLVAHERPSIAAIRAVGVSRTVVAGVVATQGVCYGLLGAATGIALTYPAAALNRVAASLFGFENLVQVSVRILAVGCLTAAVAGVVSAVVAGWRAAGTEPLAVLER